MSTLNSGNSSNPYISSGSRIALQVPKEIKIKLVNSSELLNLKIWSVLASFSSNASVGMWVWYCQNTVEATNKVLNVVSIISTILTLGFIGLSIYYNYKLKQETIEIPYEPNE